LVTFEPPAHVSLKELVAFNHTLLFTLRESSSPFYPESGGKIKSKNKISRKFVFFSSKRAYKIDLEHPENK